jgi:hypothetical protein
MISDIPVAENPRHAVMYFSLAAAYALLLVALILSVSNLQPFYTKPATFHTVAIVSVPVI